MSNYRKAQISRDEFKLKAGIVCKNGEPMTPIQIGKELNHLQRQANHHAEIQNELMIRVAVLDEILGKLVQKTDSEKP